MVVCGSFIKLGYDDDSLVYHDRVSADQCLKEGRTTYLL